MLYFQGECSYRPAQEEEEEEEEKEEEEEEEEEEEDAIQLRSSAGSQFPITPLPRSTHPVRPAAAQRRTRTTRRSA